MTDFVSKRRKTKGKVREVSSREAKREEILYKKIVADCKGNTLVYLQRIEVASIYFLVLKTKCRHFPTPRLLLENF